MSLDFVKVKIQTKTKNVLNPWMTKALLKSSQKKQTLYETFLKNKTNKKALTTKPITVSSTKSKTNRNKMITNIYK